MKLLALPAKFVRGLPYAVKELRAQVSERTPFFIAKPRIVHLWRNAPCNARCIMCDFGFRPLQELQNLYKPSLEDALIPRLLHQIQQLSGAGTMVSYMGGEPTLSSSLLDWLDCANGLKLDFRFTTNGYLITQEVARRLVAANLFNIGISLESLDPTINEQIRPKENGTAKTINAIETLLAERQRQHARLSVNVKCTLTDLNLESILGIVERWGQRDGVLITPQMFEAVEGMPEATLKKLWISDVSRIEKTVAGLKELKARGYNVNADAQALDNFIRVYREDPQKKSTMHKKTVEDQQRAGCSIGNDNLFLVHGKVHLCPLFPSLGDLTDESLTLKDLWTSEAARKCRQQIKVCNKLCTMSCLRRSSLLHKVKTFLKM